MGDNFCKVMVIFITLSLAFPSPKFANSEMLYLEGHAFPDYIGWFVIWSHCILLDMCYLCRKSRIMPTSKLDNPHGFLQLFWKLPYFAFWTSEVWFVRAKLCLEHSVMGSDLLSTFLITRLAFICPVPLFRSNSASLILCYLWSLPITWAAFPSSLFLWLKPEPHNLTTLATASVKRSLLSRTYSLVMGTRVH